jgi:hypothetical protein
VIPRPLLRVAYAAQKRLWRWLRPRTRGVKVMLFNRARRRIADYRDRRQRSADW